MNAKFQIGDFVRLKRGENKGELAEVIKVNYSYRIDRYEYTIRFRNTRLPFRTDLRYSYDLDKADAPITAKDLRKFGYASVSSPYRYKSTNTTIEHFFPSNKRKALGDCRTSRGFEHVVLETIRDAQDNITRTNCMIEFSRNTFCDSRRDPSKESHKDEMKDIHISATINTVSELRKIMSFIQSI